ncbi:AAA family ATPase [Acinetobacter baumannii]|uniref:AAA family ATPase n=1 Tax=Acinetobacter baumannii TaxID=470 RepID=UPI0025A0E5E1|nr:AAA family ATPase [Acinetobacter baumannii]
MITNYSIENFKVFSEKTDLEFAPITLIYGPNSSGKSSIIQSLLVLKESLLSSNSLKSNNKYFELGSYLSVALLHKDLKDNTLLI